MIHRVISIGRWVVDFLFATDDYDIDGVLGCLYDVGASDSVMNRAEDLMRSCEYNCGLTYTNGYTRRAIVLIGPTTSGDEFINSLVHEVRHLSDAIAEGLGVPLNSERPAYISGDTVRSLAGIICRLGCRK